MGGGLRRGWGLEFGWSGEDEVWFLHLGFSHVHSRPTPAL